MTTLREAVRTAIATGDGKRAGRIAMQLRAQGFRYSEVFDFAREAVPSLTSGEWETLMEAADDADAES